MKLGEKGVAGDFRRRNWGESNQNTLHVCIKSSNNKTLSFKKIHLKDLLLNFLNLPDELKQINSAGPQTQPSLVLFTLFATDYYE